MVIIVKWEKGIKSQKWTDLNDFLSGRTVNDEIELAVVVALFKLTLQLKGKCFFGLVSSKFPFLPHSLLDSDRELTIYR